MRAVAPAPPLEGDEELVAGRRPVEEAFAAGRPARRLLVTPQRRQALERIVLHATTLRIPIVEVEGGSLTSLAGFDGHQGVAVIVDARRFASVDDILARSIEHKEAAFVLVLDSLEDPQNVGTLLRSAEAAGVHGVAFPTERQAPLTPAAIKASAGATEHLLLAPVDDLPGALTDLHLRGLRIIGSDAEAAMTAREADLRGPIAIVVGSEGHGLSPAVRRRCDLFVRIPMRGFVGSLNAAVAGSILVFEALGQRDPGARPDPARRPAARPTSPHPIRAAAPPVGPEAGSPEPANGADPEPSAAAPQDQVPGLDAESADEPTAESRSELEAVSPGADATQPPSEAAADAHSEPPVAPAAAPPEPAYVPSDSAFGAQVAPPKSRARRKPAKAAKPAAAAPTEAAEPPPELASEVPPGAAAGPPEPASEAPIEPAVEPARKRRPRTALTAAAPDATTIDGADLLPDDTAAAARPKRTRA